MMYRTTLERCVVDPLSTIQVRVSGSLSHLPISGTVIVQRLTCVLFSWYIKDAEGQRKQKHRDSLRAFRARSTNTTVFCVPQQDATVDPARNAFTNETGLAGVSAPTSPYQSGQGASQMVIDNANSNPEESASIPTELWCSVCGCHLRLEVHDFRKPLNRIVINGTCLNTECPMYYQTLSPNGWMDQSVLSNYTPKAIIQFDVWTGITTQVVDQHIGNQIAWLMSRYDAEQIIAFERWINVHQHDDDFALMLSAFCEAASDVPDYSNVCDTRLQGR